MVVRREDGPARALRQVRDARRGRQAARDEVAQVHAQQAARRGVVEVRGHIVCGGAQRIQVHAARVECRAKHGGRAATATYGACSRQRASGVTGASMRGTLPLP